MAIVNGESAFYPDLSSIKSSAVTVERQNDIEVLSGSSRYSVVTLNINKLIPGEVAFTDTFTPVSEQIRFTLVSNRFGYVKIFVVNRGTGEVVDIKTTSVDIWNTYITFSALVNTDDYCIMIENVGQTILKMTASIQC